MAKRKEFDIDSADDVSPPHKFPKHKAQRFKSKDLDDSYEMVDVVNDLMATPPRTQYRNDVKEPNSSTSGKIAAALSPAKSSKRRKNRAKESGTSSDEERWLDAIESGKLEEVDDELKKIKNPKLMTARQRAMYERTIDKEQSPGRELLMSLPIGYKEKIMTAESIQKAQLKSQKRKQLADEKREKDKQKTMERLLKKQGTKQRFQGKNRMLKMIQPMMVYHSSDIGSLISLPHGHEFPIKKQTYKDPPKPIVCGAKGCTNLKVYNCSKTNVPLCSFRCYQKNAALHTKKFVSDLGFHYSTNI